ncbi:hypothetical protein C8A00DRAFT_39444 [Chaetomidium leptoderma]|uniref:4-coumarate:coenzyme A ligase n=1 Tax=Chaetomidium leptoderma TaxID=669021 RepID=A0AAN6VY34_9PEZI|nr:hypothetical protein C8A00DRAFT_39444 [Chaetomidium leptoderma]
MPVRIPAATRTEIIAMGAAGVTGFAPFYLMAPGAEARLSKQTVKWAPRWERNITFFKNPVERGIQRVTPPIERTVHRIEHRLPLEKAAKRTEKGIKKNLDRLGIKHT